MKFVGIALGGGKTNKTCLSVIEYFPKERKVFLRSLYENVGRTKHQSADEALIERLNEISGSIETLCVNAPIQLPICLRCRLKCPGVEKCRQKEVQWLRSKYRALNKTLRPKRYLTPYTERCVDFFLTHELEEKFSPGHGLGANHAPLAARLQFLLKQLSVPVKEVFPRASLWRIGRSLNVPKSVLRFHKHAVDGEGARRKILDALIKDDIAFLYVQDVRLMVENGQAFDAFICAMSGLLDYRKQSETQPKGYPKNADWICIPSLSIDW